MKKEPLSIMIVKTILAVIIFAGLGTIIIGGAWLIGKQGMISLPSNDKSECKIDSDCELAYTGSNLCPCDTSLKEYKCFLSKKAAKIKNEQRKKRRGVRCVECLGGPQHTCKCANGKCEKIKEKVEEVVITTDKMEYSGYDKINIKITNNINADVFFVGPIDRSASLKFYGYYNPDDTWREIPHLWKSLATKEKMIFNESVDFNIDLKHFSSLSYSKYRLEFVYSLKEFENTYNNSHELIAEANKIYSNEFTIKEKPALDMRCSEHIIQFDCSIDDEQESKCQGMKNSFEFDFFNTRKCFIRTIPCSCSFEPLFKTLEECQEVCEKSDKEVKYQIFSTGLGTSSREEIIDYAYIYKNDKLPKTIEFEDNIIIVQKIEIQKTGGFMAYATILYNGKEKKIGFWHPDGKVQNKENGCLDKNNKQVCGGVLAMNIKEWTEESTKEEKEKGILTATYIKRFSLQEIDYDFSFDDWNYIKIILSLYREPNYPITIF